MIEESSTYLLYSLVSFIIGWRKNADGSKIYMTFRNGAVVSGEGKDAMALFLGDNKGKKGKENKK